MSSLEGAAGVLISSMSDPLETSGTSVAMRGASSTVKSDVSLTALMRALSLRADLPSADFLDRLATAGDSWIQSSARLRGPAHFSCTRHCPDQEA